MVGPSGFEPPTPALSTRCSNQLSYGTVVGNCDDDSSINLAPHTFKGWWSQTGSNRRPPECKSGALPTELWPHLVEVFKTKLLKNQRNLFCTINHNPRDSDKSESSTLFIV